MKIYFTNGGSVAIEEKLAKILKHKFNDVAGRTNSSGFIEVYDNEDLVFVLNKEHILYIK